MNNFVNIDVYKYYYQLSKILCNYKNKEVVFFCVGNYKIWYDSFASCVCLGLKKIGVNGFIYGGKDFPILPDSLTDYMNWVENSHPNACVIVVDNLLTFNKDDCGKLIISQRKTNLAGLVNKLSFGDVSVLLTTYPYENYKEFIQKQQQITDNLIKALEIFKINTQNDKICI